MRKIIISFCILLAALSLKAQPVSGIRIDGGDTPILVYFGGRQMCYPTTTCFVANLKPGNYTIEVYASRPTRPGERVWKGERLYNDRVYFNDIIVEERGDIRPGRPGRPGNGQGGHRPDYNRYDRVMNDQLFKKFFDSVKNEPFEKDRMGLITTALANSDFTSEQCLQLVKFYTFDNERLKIMKMMYPNIVDKEAFFTVIGTLTFSSNKTKMNDFIKEYEGR
jgi:hypothetical protein